MMLSLLEMKMNTQRPNCSEGVSNGSSSP